MGTFHWLLDVAVAIHSGPYNMIKGFGVFDVNITYDRCTT